MKWEDERYVRLYTRDTTTWKLLPWQSKCLLPLLLRKLDRAGHADVGADADAVEGIAALTDMPVDLVAAGLPALLKREVFKLEPGGRLVMPNFVQAQECKQSDRARQAFKRERDRLLGVNFGQTVTDRDDPSRSVTNRHDSSHDVTPSLAVPSLAIPRESESPPAPARSNPGATDQPPPLEPRTSETRVRNAPGIPTLMPDDITPTRETIDRCLMAGFPDPTPLMERFKAHHRASATESASWQDTIFKWAGNEKSFAMSRMPRPDARPMIQPYKGPAGPRQTEIPKDTGEFIPFAKRSAK